MRKAAPRPDRLVQIYVLRAVVCLSTHRASCVHPVVLGMDSFKGPGSGASNTNGPAESYQPGIARDACPKGLVPPHRVTANSNSPKVSHGPGALGILLKDTSLSRNQSVHLLLFLPRFPTASERPSPLGEAPPTWSRAMLGARRQWRSMEPVLSVGSPCADGPVMNPRARHTDLV